MNARILRKWSTKTNLMPSTVCLYVPAVLLLLLVICTQLTVTNTNTIQQQRQQTQQQQQQQQKQQQYQQYQQYQEIIKAVEMGYIGPQQQQQLKSHNNFNTPIKVTATAITAPATINIPTITQQVQQLRQHSPAEVIKEDRLRADLAQQGRSNNNNLKTHPVKIFYPSLHITQQQQQQQQQQYNKEEKEGDDILKNIGPNHHALNEQQQQQQQQQQQEQEQQIRRRYRKMLPTHYHQQHQQHQEHNQPYYYQQQTQQQKQQQQHQHQHHPIVTMRTTITAIAVNGDKTNNYQKFSNSQQQLLFNNYTIEATALATSSDSNRKTRTSSNNSHIIINSNRNKNSNNNNNGEQFYRRQFPLKQQHKRSNNDNYDGVTATASASASASASPSKQSQLSLPSSAKTITTFGAAAVTTTTNQLLSKMPIILRSNNATLNIHKITIHYKIESYEVPTIALPLRSGNNNNNNDDNNGDSSGVSTNINAGEMDEENVRRLEQQAARNRRNSVIGTFKRFYSNDHNNNNNNNNSNNNNDHNDYRPKQKFQNSRKYYLSQRQKQQPQQQRQQQRHKQQSQQQSFKWQHQHRQQYRQQHHRKHTRRYCSARDPAQLAFEAPTVFEGKVVSMSPDRHGNFSATLEVREVFKQQIGYHLQKYLRLQFEFHNESGECDIYREQLRPRGQVRGITMEPGRIYLFFTQQIDIGNFTVLGVPIRKTRRVIESVRNAVSENYAQYASIRSITANNRTVENGKELRIICKVYGRPPPKVTWFKDHKSINRNRKLYKFLHYKKRSELVIRYFNTSDAGRYECRAKNKVNRNVERRAIIIKAYPVPMFESTHLIGGSGNPCPDDALEFCFNGGTCKFFSEIGSYSCICPEGFIGERCDRKEVNNMPPSTYSNEQECGEKKFLGSYYC